MGVKKSTVCTSAVAGAIWYTPASSARSKPTRTLGSCCRANFPSTVSSAAGLSLDAQPAALTDSVSRNGFVSGMQSLYRVAGNQLHTRTIFNDLPGVLALDTVESRIFQPALHQPL